MNKVILIGRLTKDPETRQAGETQVTRFTLAVDRRYKKEGGQDTDFPNIVTFGKTAEFANKYLHKGVKIAIDGHIVTGSYKNKDGATIYTTEVIADSVEFAESKKVETSEPADGFIDAEYTDDLPFK